MPHKLEWGWSRENVNVPGREENLHMAYKQGRACGVKELNKIRRPGSLDHGWRGKHDPRHPSLDRVKG